MISAFQNCSKFVNQMNFVNLLNKSGQPYPLWIYQEAQYMIYQNLPSMHSIQFNLKI